MQNSNLIITRHMLAILAAFLIYQHERRLSVTLPLGLDFHFNVDDSHFRLTKKAARIIKNITGSHSYPNSPIINVSDTAMDLYFKCCKTAELYNLKSLHDSIRQKVDEHFGKDQSFDDSGVIFLVHKFLNSKTPGQVRLLVTEAVSKLMFSLATKGIAHLPYGVTLSLKRNRSSYDLIIKIRSDKKLNQM